MLASEAGLPLIGLLVKRAPQRFALIAGEGLQLIQQQLFPRSTQVPITGCCRSEPPRNPFSLPQSPRSAWLPALRRAPRPGHGQLLLMEQF